MSSGTNSCSSIPLLPLFLAKKPAWSDLIYCLLFIPGLVWLGWVGLGFLSFFLSVYIYTHLRFYPAYLWSELLGQQNSYFDYLLRYVYILLFRLPSIFNCVHFPFGYTFWAYCLLRWTYACTYMYWYSQLCIMFDCLVFGSAIGICCSRLDCTCKGDKIQYIYLNWFQNLKDVWLS